MFTEILAIIRDVSPITLVIAVLVYFLNRSIDNNSSDDKRYDELFERHLELEVKFTKCREENAILKGDKALTEQSRTFAVDKLLDDTHTLADDIIELEEKLRERDETITILQQNNKQLRERLSVVTVTEPPNEMQASQDTMDSGKD